MSAVVELLGLAGAAPGSPVASAAEERAGLIEMIAEAEAAALSPKDPGGLSYGVRSAIAVWMAEAEGCPALAARYREMTEPGEVPKAVQQFAEAVAMQPRDVVADDIAVLQGAGVADADIVRLCELVAFVSFQIRVVKGLAAVEAAT